MSTIYDVKDGLPRDERVRTSSLLATSIRKPELGAVAGLVLVLVVTFFSVFASLAMFTLARAVHFGARVLILDAPTSALGVAQTSMVLKSINIVRAQGLAVTCITHDVRHGFAVGNRVTVMNRGRTLGTHARGEITIDALQNLMAGGRDLQGLSSELGGTI